MGSQSEVLRLVGEVTERYGSLEAFFTRLHAEFDDRPTTQLPVIDPAALEPMAWSSAREVPASAGMPSPAAQVEAPSAAPPAADRERYEEEQRTTPLPAGPALTSLRGAAGMWGRLTGRIR